VGAWKKINIRKRGNYRITTYLSSIQHKSLILYKFVIASSQMT
jgi:hypothetical protein